MRIYDNTEISTNRACGRKYFFRHVRHWVYDGPPPLALGFGLGIHAACDSIWKGIHEGERNHEKLAADGFSSFMNVWNESGYPPIDSIDMVVWEDMAPRTPDIAADIIINYVKDNAAWIRSCELIDIEKPFLVPIHPDRDDIFYGGRWDKLIRKDGRIWIVDHKTTAWYRKSTKFAEDFLESFSPNSQIDGYLFGGNLAFPGDITGVMVDAILVHKTVRAFSKIPVVKDPGGLHEWLWEVHEEIERIERYRRRVELLKESPNQSMEAFPKNTSNCFSYNSRCPYLDVCKVSGARAHQAPMPSGFKEDPWSPLYQDQLKKLMEE